MPTNSGLPSFDLASIFTRPRSSASVSAAPRSTSRFSVARARVPVSKRCASLVRYPSSSFFISPYRAAPPTKRSTVASSAVSAPVTMSAMRPALFIFGSPLSVGSAICEPSHRSGCLSLEPAGVRGCGYPSLRGGVRLPAALRRRHPLLRLVDRPGTAPAPAPGRHGQPLYAPAPSVRARLQAGVRDALGGDARGGPDQAPPACREAPPVGHHR